MASTLPTVTELADGIRRGDRMLLARAITLVESSLPAHHALGQELLTELLPDTGKAARIGVTGVPGVGKSTFLDAFGMQLASMGQSVAVLAVDPSSRLSGGSILGDKARMHRLAQESSAFIRPSPSGTTLGGVAGRTRESMLLCEAAGFDVILIETVGVGQSETVVADMVDFFLVLMLPGAGDELQGIKKGILELADVIAVNKADGDNLERAQRAQRDYANALHYLTPRHTCWTPKAVCLSGLTGSGLEELWEIVEAHQRLHREAGVFESQRQEQMGRWMWAQIEERLLSAFRSSPAVQAKLVEVEEAVSSGAMPPTAAADLLLSLLNQS